MLLVSDPIDMELSPPSSPAVDSSFPAAPFPPLPTIIRREPPAETEKEPEDRAPPPPPDPS